MKFNSVEEILDYAIAREEEASQFYTDLAAKVDKPYMAEVFLSFAKEEQGHKAKLLGVKEGNFDLPSQDKVLDMKIAENLVEVELRTDIDLQGALILAMKAEKSAFRLYNDLAQAADNDKVKDLFTGLAQEEAKHKLRFEIEYDDYAYREN